MRGTGKQTSILIVDDEQSITDIVGQYLAKKGYDVMKAASGEEAVEHIRNQQIDCVLTDIKMPGMSGVDLLKWIKDFNHFLPVIITTGFPTLDTAIEALKLGAYDYLTKPFHLEEIGEKIRRALLNRQLEEENLLFSKLVSLHEVTKILSSTHQLTDLNDRFLDFSIRMSHADTGALLYFDTSGTLRIVSTQPRDDYVAFWNREIMASATRWVHTTNEPLALEQEMEELPLGVSPLPEDIRSLVIFPLRTVKRSLGMLCLARLGQDRPFSSVYLEIISVLVSQATISIENTRLYHSLQSNYLETIRGFALAVEAKDKYTHGHSENVKEYSLVLAAELGLKGPELERIKYAGLLHDIGKIGVPEDILNKPGKLSQREFDEIKKHPELGIRIIERVPFLQSLVPMVLHHHEFYNGAGYPKGLSQDAIPYGARILAVADAFEAMTSDRPYRDAMPFDVALGILEKERANQFDPEVVDTFTQVVRSGKLKRPQTSTA